jgi:hypothetical protein
MDPKNMKSLPSGLCAGVTVYGAKFKLPKNVIFCKMKILELH